jgi:acyl-CoA thioester hydrolase
MREHGGVNSGAISGGVHVFPVRVYYEDTDAGGVVYYANYLKFAERARTEMMHLLADGYGELLADGEIAFAVRRCEADFLAPARLDDLLEVRTTVTDASGSSVTAEQVIRHDESDITRLRMRLACVNQAGRPTRIPSALRAALQTLTPS